MSFGAENKPTAYGMAQLQKFMQAHQQAMGFKPVELPPSGPPVGGERDGGFNYCG